MTILFWIAFQFHTDISCYHWVFTFISHSLLWLSWGKAYKLLFAFLEPKKLNLVQNRKRSIATIPKSSCHPLVIQCQAFEYLPRFWVPATLLGSCPHNHWQYMNGKYTYYWNLADVELELSSVDIGVYTIYQWLMVCTQFW